MQETKKVAFIGLGAMGWGIAGNLALAARDGRIDSPVTVWNRTTERAERHAAEFGTCCAYVISDLSKVDVIISCLPTSVEVTAMAEKLAPDLKSGTLWIDCTSGDPNTTKNIAYKLREVGVKMIDCPVSGGPQGAASGQLTAMVGGDDCQEARHIISLFARNKIVDCGPIGAGHAVKAMNNCLNAAHIIVAGEALLALTKCGVQPEVALNAINASSGRSLQTEVRIPTEILTRKFDYGFKLGLMLKDVRTAVEILGSREEMCNDDCLCILPVVKNMMKKAVDDQGYHADYTCVLRTLEREAGVELHAASSTEPKII